MNVIISNERQAEITMKEVIRNNYNSQGNRIKYEK